MGKKRKRSNIYRLPVPEVVEVVMFEAGVPAFESRGTALSDVRFTREQLEHDVLPRVRLRPEVIDAWMEGDKLVVKQRVTKKEPRPESGR